ncbi:MAG: FHA domain-containing protein [Candidatus Contendobacter sp.]|nr:FHA domain-containing protein [Candidatus Contendobacter sp.]MDG4559448.1 FHA domain-containing protein [Candidatus Contendobacter sp.]
MPLYRGFFKKGPTIPEQPVEPTRRIVRSEPLEKARPTAPAAPPPATPPAPPPATPAPPALVPGRTVPPSVTEAPSVAAGPVVGWLAIVAGPGRGQTLQLSYGVNDIGSGPHARIRLNFGDPTIAADNHAAIIYTTRSRRFYLAQSAASETWLNGQPVRESVELVGGETVRFGQTQVRFVPLCGPGFDWRDGD